MRFHLIFILFIIGANLNSQTDLFNVNKIIEIENREESSSFMAFDENDKLLLSVTSNAYRNSLWRLKENYELDTILNRTVKKYDSVNSIQDFSIGGKQQKDGKLLIVGNYNSRKFTSFYIARYLTNGELDLTFGEKGKAQIGLFPKKDLGVRKANGIKLDSIVRQQGKPIANLDKFDWEQHIQFYHSELFLLPDGKIVGSLTVQQNIGKKATSEIIIYRLLPNGKIDLTFGENGITNVVLENKTFKTPYITIGDNGTIFLAGNYKSWNDEDEAQSSISVFSLNSEGNFNKEIGENGIIYFKGPRKHYLPGYIQFKDNELTIAGTAFDVMGMGNVFFLTLMLDNPISTKFENHKLNIYPNKNLHLKGVLPLSDGSFLLSGKIRNGDYLFFMVVNNDKTINEKFAKEGVLTAYYPEAIRLTLHTGIIKNEKEAFFVSSINRYKKSFDLLILSFSLP